MTAIRKLSLAVLGTALCIGIPSNVQAQVQAQDAKQNNANRNDANQNNADAQQAAAQGDAPADPQAQGRAQAQANPEIERQRQQAEQQGRQNLDRDAIAAIEETRKAIQAIEQGKNDEAMAAIERANGKINILVARSPAAGLIPVNVEAVIIDAAPLDVKAIRARAKAAERAVDDKDYPWARVLLAGLVSELRVRTYSLPLSTYPIAMQQAARLLDQQKKEEAKATLQVALNTLAIIDRVTPLPLVIAEAAISQAQAERDKNKDVAQRHLQTARNELSRAKELGYAGNDPEYVALNDAINDLEKQLGGNQNTSSAFARLKEKVSSFFHRQSQTEKKAEVASR